MTKSERDDLTRRVEDCLREVAQLRERNQELEGEMSKAARRGKLEEISFEEEARSWAGIHVSEKLARGGDYILAYRDPSGTPLEPQIIVDNKDKSSVTESDLRKLIRDAKERRCITGRHWLPRDLEVLKPVFERMRTEGADFLQKNSALAEEVRRTFVDLDEVEKELKKAAKAIDSVSDLTAKYRGRLQVLCNPAASAKIAPKSERRSGTQQEIGA
jgi:hypothetical protein